MKKVLSLLTGTLLTLFSAAAGELPREIRLQAGQLELSLARKRSYALNTLTFDGQKLLIDKGANGHTLAQTKGIYWGSSEKSEKLLSLQITVDGKIAVPETGTLSGRKIVVERISQIGNLRYTILWTLTPEKLCWQTRFQASADQKVHALYLCAWSFDPATESFFGTDAAGKEFEGNFTRQGGWQVNRELRSLTMCWPQKGHALLIRFPQIIPAKGRKCTVWDLKQYHKFYLELPQPPLISAGSESPVYTIELLPIAGKNIEEFRAGSVALQIHPANQTAK